MPAIREWVTDDDGRTIDVREQDRLADQRRQWNVREDSERIRQYWRDVNEADGRPREDPDAARFYCREIERCHEIARRDFYAGLAESGRRNDAIIAYMIAAQG